MNATDMQVFFEAGVGFFEKVTGEKVYLCPGSLHFGHTEMLEYTGVIRLSGSSEGVVCLSVPGEMLEELLEVSGEREHGESMQLDLVGEAASIIACNARKQLGAQLQIASPETLGTAEAEGLALPYTRLVLPIQWREHRANLLLAFHQNPMPAELCEV